MTVRLSDHCIEPIWHELFPFRYRNQEAGNIAKLLDLHRHLAPFDLPYWSYICAHPFHELKVEEEAFQPMEEAVYWPN